jgi:hypothetical protein
MNLPTNPREYCNAIGDMVKHIMRIVLVVVWPDPQTGAARAPFLDSAGLPL